MNWALWIAQIVLALFFAAAGYTHGLMPFAEVAKNAPWVLDIPPELTRFIGLSELAGAVGVLVPRFTRLAALGLMTLMVLAAGFHMSRGEPRIIALHLSVAAIAACVVWGRGRGRRSAR